MRLEAVLTSPMNRLPILLLAVAGTTGCIPDLTTPKGLEDESVIGENANDWEAPENAWEMFDGPPPDLVAEGYQRGEVFPDLRMRDQNGDEIAVWQWYGMVVTVDISTMWCGPCQGLAAEVDHTWKDYKDDGFMYITMMPENVSGESPNTADLNVWADRFDITAPVLSDRDAHSYDIAPDQAWPRILIIGRDMRVTESQVTPPEDSAIRAAIESAL